jgi:hypothetical protein
MTGNLGSWATRNTSGLSGLVEDCWKKRGNAEGENSVPERYGRGHIVMKPNLFGPVSEYPH